MSKCDEEKVGISKMGMVSIFYWLDNLGKVSLHETLVICKLDKSAYSFKVVKKGRRGAYLL